MPADGPLLVVPNHDSQWDPIVVGIALRKRRRLRFLARANLWKIPGLGPVLYAMGQIPIERGAGDARALERAVEALRGGRGALRLPRGEAVTRRGASRPQRGGAAGAVVPRRAGRPVRGRGDDDYVRFPKRPRISVSFFEPAAGQPRPDEDPAELAARLLEEIRALVPPQAAGRDMGAAG